jgi:Mce-associated membrane protein
MMASRPRDVSSKATEELDPTSAAALAEQAEADAGDADADVGAGPAEVADGPRRRFLRLPNWRITAVSACVLLLCALLAASGYMLWQDRQTSQRQAEEAQVSAAARQGVVNLMSLDFNHGDRDIQRLIDSTTGQFRQDFEKNKNDFLTVMKDSKVITAAEVRATAIESMTKDSAVVLVAATSHVSNSASAQPTPRTWRLSVSLQRDGDRLKMSKVEFVP